MINFVIYEDEEYFRELYKKEIHKFMCNDNDRTAVITHFS